MKLLKNRSMSLYLGFVLILVMLIGGSAITTLADSGPVTATVSGGSLTESGDFSGASASVILNGHDQTVSYTLPITVTDATGSGAGWNLTITSTEFRTAGVPSIKLSPKASQITGVTASCNTGSTCTNPTNAVTYPQPVPAGLTTAPQAQKFYDATANSGLGTFTITPTIGVLIPGNAYEGTYSSTVTLSIVSGP